MSSNNKNKYPAYLGFIDLLLNLAVSFCFLFMLSQILINPNKAQTTSAEREGFYIIEAKWNDGVDADVDLWVKAPNGERSGFASRDNGSMSLLRDDLGNINDRYVNAQGQEVLNPLNHEEVTIRTPIAGDYTVNLHYFRAPEPPQNKIEIKIVIKQIKENIVLAERTLKMENAKEELTAFIFTIDNANEIKDIKQPDVVKPWVTNNTGIMAP